jgi:hypothetical protein
MTRSCERAQAQLFADILRQEVVQMSKSITKAESRWRHRCEVEGDIDPPERLTLVRGRMDEAVKMLDRTQRPISRQPVQRDRVAAMRALPT